MTHTPDPNENNPDDIERDDDMPPRQRWSDDFADDDDEDDTIESLRDERDALLQKLADAAAGLQRAQVDLRQQVMRAEDAQKAAERTEARAAEEKKYALGSFVKDVLPVIDTLELGLRAIPAADRAADPKYDKLATGIEKTLQQLSTVFNKYGIEEINPINAAFDENKHEVVSLARPEDADEPETVVAVAQKGYALNGRLLRAAKVVITPAD